MVGSHVNWDRASGLEHMFDLLPPRQGIRHVFHLLTRTVWPPEMGARRGRRGAGNGRGRGKGRGTTGRAEQNKIRRTGGLGGGVAGGIRHVRDRPEVPKSAKPPAKARGRRARIVECDVQGDLRRTGARPDGERSRGGSRARERGGGPRASRGRTRTATRREIRHGETVSMSAACCSPKDEPNAAESTGKMSTRKWVHTRTRLRRAAKKSGRCPDASCWQLTQRRAGRRRVTATMGTCQAGEPKTHTTSRTGTENEMRKGKKNLQKDGEQRERSQDEPGEGRYDPKRGMPCELTCVE